MLQLEKKKASVWTCEKLSGYLFGLKSFKVITDHKPLVPLINEKNLDEVPIRCCTSNLLVTDTLSKHPLTITEKSEVVAIIEQHRPASLQKLQKIAQATKKKTRCKLC